MNKPGGAGFILACISENIDRQYVRARAALLYARALNFPQADIYLYTNLVHHCTGVPGYMLGRETLAPYCNIQIEILKRTCIVIMRIKCMNAECRCTCNSEIGSLCTLRCIPTYNKCWKYTLCTQNTGDCRMLINNVICCVGVV